MIDKFRCSSLTRLIFMVTGVQLVMSIVVHAYWLATSSESILRLYFDYFGVLIFLFFTGLQLFFSIAVYRDFSIHHPLGSAWFYIMLGSIALFVGNLFTHLLTVNTALNPMMYWVSALHPDFKTTLANVGTVLGGPVFMVLLGAGLYLALRVYKQSGMSPTLTIFDKVLIGATFLYSLMVIVGVVHSIQRHPEQVTAQHALTWPGDYLLSVLLLEAVFLRRSAANMGWGFVSKTWSAFVAGIFLTSFCSLMNWLTAYGILTWQQTSFTWYLWFPASAAFALAPAYQWEAVRTAQLRLSKRVEELSLSVS